VAWAMAETSKLTSRIGTWDPDYENVLSSKMEQDLISEIHYTIFYNYKIYHISNKEDPKENLPGLAEFWLQS
jgi:hypothetical protein